MVSTRNQDLISIVTLRMGLTDVAAKGSKRMALPYEKPLQLRISTGSCASALNGHRLLGTVADSFPLCCKSVCV